MSATGQLSDRRPHVCSAPKLLNIQRRLWIFNSFERTSCGWFDSVEFCYAQQCLSQYVVLWAFASSIRPARLWRFFRRSFDLIAGVMYNPNPSSASSGAESHCPVQVRRHHQAICRYRRWPCRHLASDARRRTPPWQTTTLAILVAVHWWTISASFSPTRCTVYGILSSPTYINLPAHSLRVRHASTSGLQGLNFHEWQVDSWRSAQGFVIDAYQSSPFDLLPSSLLHQSTGIFAPVLAHMANLSLIECSFPPAFKTAQVLPILKKSVLDAAVLSNFRPISNLPTFDLVTRLNCNITVRFDRHLWSWFFSQTLFVCIICYRQRESIVTCEIVVTPMNSRSIVLTCIKSLLLFNHCICTFDFFKHLWVVF